MKLLRLWFGLSGPVSRKAYLLSGLFLMVIKYAGDAALFYIAAAQVLWPQQFLSPLLSTRQHLLESGDAWPLGALVAWALPFLWVGVSMTMRRAVDAGYSPWLGFLFVIPGLNYLLILAMSVAPTRTTDGGWRPTPVQASSIDRAESALKGAVVGLLIAGGMTALSTLVLGEYGSTLFFATPFLMGGASSYIHNRVYPRSVRGSIGVGVASIWIASVAVLLFALEGAFCLVMAFPIAGAAGILGALAGRVLAIHRAGTNGLFGVSIVLPLASIIGAQAPATLVEREVVSVVEIDARPDAVWPNVIKFSELPPPPELLFRLGIAYPMRAVIHGEGVGAVRDCEFSTGPFVEPITRWEPPHRLSFDVRSQPVPMHEWSPYKHVHPPHLDGYLKSRRGEFRLIELADGRTRLEGSTWYTIDLDPAPYWALWTDYLIHQIHLRVLEHIRSETLSRPSHARIRDPDIDRSGGQR